MVYLGRNWRRLRLWLRYNRQPHRELAALPQDTGSAYRSPVHFHEALDQGQSDSQPTFRVGKRPL